MTRRRVRRAVRVDWIANSVQLSERVREWELGRGGYVDSRIAVVDLMRRSADGGCPWSNAAALVVARHDHDREIVAEARGYLTDIADGRARLFTGRRS